MVEYLENGKVTIIPLNEWDESVARKFGDISIDTISREISEMEKCGYVECDDSEVFLNEAHFSRNKKDLWDLINNLTFTPANIPCSELLEVSSGGDFSKSRMSDLVRFYKMSNLGIVCLTETDIKNSSIEISIIKETLNTTINGSPAAYHLKLGHSGDKLGRLAWFSKGIAYTIFAWNKKMDCNLFSNRLFGFAQNLDIK